MLLVIEVPRENRLQGNDRELAASPGPVSWNTCVRVIINHGLKE